jgi:hypothetical protein
MLMVMDHLWYFSRQGAPLDWDYGQTDVQRALSSQLSEAGVVGQIIKAVAIASDDLVIFFCNTSTWRLCGDPTYGGQLGKVSGTIGCVDKGAYCFTSKTTIVFLSFDGIYALEAGSTAEPQEISNNNLPIDLKSIDNKLHTVTMAFDVYYKGIQINITPKSGGLSAHWWFDWDNKSFWPVLLSTTHQAYSTMYYSDENKDFLGCKDGYLRHYDMASATDDGTAISSYIWYGPIRIAGDERAAGKIIEIGADTAVGSGNITWEIYVGNSYEQCLLATAFATGSWSLEGINPKTHVHAGGGCYALKLSGGENIPWAIENINGILEITSRIQRLL